MPKDKDPIDELRGAVSDIDDRLGDVQEQLTMMRPALAGLAGLDNVAAGIAQLVEVLAPLGSVGNEPEPLEEAVVAAINLIIQGAATAPVVAIVVPNLPIPFIGQPVAAAPAGPLVAAPPLPAPRGVNP